MEEKRRAVMERRRDGVMTTTVELIEKCRKVYLSLQDFSEETLTLESLCEWLIKSLSSTPNSRREAESKLEKASVHPLFPIQLLRLVFCSESLFSSSSCEIMFYPDHRVREAAIIKLKNHFVLLNNLHHVIIPKCEKELLKTLILCLLISHPASSSADAAAAAYHLLLLEAFDTLCDNNGNGNGDSREIESWHRPLFQLFSMLRYDPHHASSITQIENIANSITSKFLPYSLTPLLFDELKDCFDNLSKSVFDIFLSSAALINGHHYESTANTTIIDNIDDADVLRFRIDSQLLCCRIFCSLTVLSKFFSNYGILWALASTKYFAYRGLKEGERVFWKSPLEEICIALCETLCVWLIRCPIDHSLPKNIFSTIFELRVLQRSDLSYPLLTHILNFLTEEAASCSDRLLIATINCFIKVWDIVCCWNVCHYYIDFYRILTIVVLPNMRLRDEDVNLFASDYLEFIRSDIDIDIGGSTDSRRGIASKLLNKLAADYVHDYDQEFPYDKNHPFGIFYAEDFCIPLVLAETVKLLSSFSENPTLNWKDKYCAIHLFLSLVTKDPMSDLVPSESKKRRKLNKKLVYALDFFKANIVPELQGQDVNDLPVLKSGALKFLTIFHNHVPMSLVVQLIPHVVRFLASDSMVLRSYAAICIEELLSTRDCGVQTRVHNISKYIPLVVTNLFDALRASSQFEENPYIMRCIKQVFGVADIPQAILESCFYCLVSVLRELCICQKNPLFHRYLFEALAVVLRRASQDDSTLLSVFDAALFPIFQSILSDHTIEILPSVFQLLAQFVELSKRPIPPYYMKFFELILSCDLWKKPSNVPSLMVLLQAFLQQASIELTQNGDLIKLVHMVVLLVSSSITVEVGFHILNSLLDNLEYDAFAPLAFHMWPTIFLLLQDYPKVKFLKYFVLYISIFLIKHGAVRLEQSMNSAQPDMFVLIVDVFWIPSLKLIKDTADLKLAAVASTMLVSGSPTLLDAARWDQKLNGILTLHMQLKYDRAEEGQSYLGTQDTEGSSACFVKKKEDPLKNIEDATEFLVASLVDVSAQSPGKCPRIIQKSFDSVNSAALELFRSTYNRVVV